MYQISSESPECYGRYYKNGLLFPETLYLYSKWLNRDKSAVHFPNLLELGTEVHLYGLHDCSAERLTGPIFYMMMQKQQPLTYHQLWLAYLTMHSFSPSIDCDTPRKCIICQTIHCLLIEKLISLSTQHVVSCSSGCQFRVHRQIVSVVLARDGAG